MECISIIPFNMRISFLYEFSCSLIFLLWSLINELINFVNIFTLDKHELISLNFI